MALTASIPNRRKSIATTDQNHKPDALPRRKRAHSIAPGDLDRLSPASKARRSLAPRKSILKPTLLLENDALVDEEGEEGPSQQSHNNSQQDDNARPISLSRRVSFAAHAFVRLFETNQQNTNSTASPQSSPRSEEPAPSQINDENAYQGSRRQSSGDDKFSDEDEEMDDDDMEMTSALPTNILRRRSESLGGVRAPLGVVAMEPAAAAADTTMTSEESMSISEGDRSILSSNADETQQLEYTVPLIKPRPPPSDAWLALRAVTHSGDQPVSDSDGEDEMELDDAVGRLLASRPSIAFGPEPTRVATEQPSFTSTQDDGEDYDDMDDGNKTMNLTAMMRRESVVDSTMDLSRVYGGPLLADETIPSQEEPVVQAQTPKAASSIFSAVTRPFSFAFTPGPASTPATKAPAPPAKSAFSVFSRPAAENPVITVEPAASSPGKRPADASHDEATPRKKVADGRGATPASPFRRQASPVRPIQPAKPPQQQDARPAPPTHIPVPVRSFATPSTSTTVPDIQKSAQSLRRPSNYFAQRKSLAGNLTQPDVPKVASSVRQSLGGPMTSTSSSVYPTIPRVVPAPPPAVQDAQMDEDLTQTTVESVASERVSTEATTEIIENPTEQWRATVEQGEEGFEDDESGPPISIEQFFDMTGIRFMEDLAAPRRSIHPGNRRSLGGAEPGLGTYAVAQAVSLPQLDLYSSVARDLESWIETSQANNKAIETDVAACTPELFREFVTAGEDEQTELITQLRLIKANTHLTARTGWYEWRMNWVGQLQATADAAFGELEADCSVLKGILDNGDALIPTLQEELESITRELQEEQRVVAEIDECDPEYLSDLKTDLADQDVQLEDLRSKLDEANGKLERVQEKIDELNGQKRENNQAIEKLQHVMHFQKNSRSAEVFRMKDELEALERLHQWKITRMQPDMVQLVFVNSFQVSLPCRNFKPFVEGIAVERVKGSRTAFKDAFPAYTDLTMHMARQVILQSNENVSTIPEVVRRLGHYWTACGLLRHQMKFLHVKYPIEVQAASVDGFKLTATVLFPKLEGKALVSFIFDRQTISTWPMSIASAGCEVIVKYGDIDGDIICNTIMDRLAESSPDMNHACLLDACVGAQEVYAQLE